MADVESGRRGSGTSFRAIGRISRRFERLPAGSLCVLMRRFYVLFVSPRLDFVFYGSKFDSSAFIFASLVANSASLPSIRASAFWSADSSSVIRGGSGGGGSGGLAVGFVSNCVDIARFVSIPMLTPPFSLIRPY